MITPPPPGDPADDPTGGPAEDRTGAGDARDATPPVDAPTAAPDGVDPAPAPSAQDVVAVLAQVPGLGVVVTDADGRTVSCTGDLPAGVGAACAGGVDGARAASGAVVRAGLGAGPPADDVPLVVGDRVLAMTRRAVGPPARPRGWVTVLRDVTEQERSAARLRAERDGTRALRARAHEADNRLHTVVSLVELGHVRKAVDFATAVLARALEVHEAIHSTVQDPVVAALLTGKAATAQQVGVVLHVDPSTRLPVTGVDPQELVLVLGNLLDNALDAAAGWPPPRWVHVAARVLEDRVRLVVADSGPGVPGTGTDDVFTPGWTTRAGTDPDGVHGQGLGLALVAATVHRLGGSIDVDRWVGARFTVELPLPRPTPGA